MLISVNRFLSTFLADQIHLDRALPILRRVFVLCWRAIAGNDSVHNGIYREQNSTTCSAKRRGYNQSEQFAIGLSKALEIPYDNVIVRKKKTATQTRKSRLERWENVENIFQVIDEQKVKGKSVLLVDDVITTGATLEACILSMQSSQVKSVGVAAIAAAR